MTDFEQIYHTYFSDVYRYIRKLSGNEHVAEEITADTFFKAIESIDRFRGDCDIRVWLCQIAKNLYFSYLKKHKQTIPMEDPSLLAIPDPVPSAEEQLACQDEARQIRELLHQIPDPYKEVFMWRVFAELSFRQIGQIYGKTENWACVTYHRARMKIKNRLEAMSNEK